MKRLLSPYVEEIQQINPRELSYVKFHLLFTESSRHAATGSSPYYLDFGQNMVTYGSTYSLLRQLEMLC